MNLRSVVSFFFLPCTGTYVKFSAFVLHTQLQLQEELQERSLPQKRVAPRLPFCKVGVLFGAWYPHVVPSLFGFVCLHDRRSTWRMIFLDLYKASVFEDTTTNVEFKLLYLVEYAVGFDYIDKGSSSYKVRLYFSL